MLLQALQIWLVHPAEPEFRASSPIVQSPLWRNQRTDVFPSEAFNTFSEYFYNKSNYLIVFKVSLMISSRDVKASRYV